MGSERGDITLFPKGTRHFYRRENTAGSFKNGYLPLIPAKYP